MSSSRLLYLDQNAWIALARGAWDRIVHPADHEALTVVINAVQAGRIAVPLSYTNIYETSKINDPARRAHLAGVQSSISGGIVFRGRRRILQETVRQYLADQLSMTVDPLPDRWFLSDLWFEAAADYTPDKFGFEFSENALRAIRQDPGYALFTYLSGTWSDEAVRVEAVRRYSASSSELLARLAARRGLVAGESFALRLRAYGATLLIDELDFLLSVGRSLGLPWNDVRDIGRSLAKKLVTDIPVLNVERELVVRLEDQARATSENDLRDMAFFVTVLPLADIMVAEKPFVNLARQAGLDRKYDTKLLVSVAELAADML